MKDENSDTGRTGEVDPDRDEFWEEEEITQGDPDEETAEAGPEEEKDSGADPDRKGKSDKEKEGSGDDKPAKKWAGKFDSPEQLEEEYNKVTGTELSRIARERNEAQVRAERAESLLMQALKGGGKKGETTQEREARIEAFTQKFADDPEGAIREALDRADSGRLKKIEERLESLVIENRNLKLQNQIADLAAKFPDEFQNKEFVAAIRDRYQQEPDLLDNEKSLERVVFEVFGRFAYKNRGKERKAGAEEATRGIETEESRTLDTGKAGAGKSGARKKSIEERIADEIVGAEISPFSCHNMGI